MSAQPELIPTPQQRRTKPQPMPTLRESRTKAATALAVCGLLVSACSTSGGDSLRPEDRAARSWGPTVPGPAMALQVTPAPYQLPAAVSGETVVPGAGGL